MSKSFTTAETMLNARTMRQWLWDSLGRDPEVVAKHMTACASKSALGLVEDFGIPRDRLFEFWDWVRPHCSDGVPGRVRRADVMCEACSKARRCEIQVNLSSGSSPPVSVLHHKQVGGRYSVCASPGALPISIKFGFGVFSKFLEGKEALLSNALQSHRPIRPDVPLNVMVPQALGRSTGTS